MKGLNKLSKKKIGIIIATAVCLFGVGVGAYKITSKNNKVDKIVESAQEKLAEGNVEEADEEVSSALELDPDNEAAKKIDEAIDKYYEVSDLYNNGKLDEAEDKLEQFNSTDYESYFTKFKELAETIREKKQTLDDTKQAIADVALQIAQEELEKLTAQLNKEELANLIEKLEDLSSQSGITPDEITDIINGVTDSEGNIDADKLKDELQNKYDEIKDNIDQDKFDEIKNNISGSIDQDKIDEIKDSINNIDKDKVDEVKDKLNGILNRN